jgi:hypothetical protein
MKIEDIEVGKRYGRLDYPGYVWLGIGKCKSFTRNEYIGKYMVIVECPEDEPHLGLIFKNIDDEYGPSPEDWELFYLLK